MLKKEVVQAVKQKQFHIYHVAHVTEGIELLTGVAAGTPDAEGRFPPESVYGRIPQKLERFSERRRQFIQGRDPETA